MNSILFYIDSMKKGGANRVMANLTQYFAERGYLVTLVNDVPPSNDGTDYDVDSRVNRIFLTTVNGSRMKKNAGRILNLRRTIGELGVEIAVSFMGPPNYRMLLSTIGLKTKKVVSVRNDPYREYGNGLKKIAANIIFLMTDGCVFQTKDAAKYFWKRTRRKAEIIYNPVNIKFYSQERLPENHHIVMVGRLQEQKNPMMLLDAFLLIEKDFPQYELDFYGEGELKPLLIERVQELGKNDRIHFHGQISDVERILASASLFVMTSDYEGMPNALMEAMAVGVPVISTDCPCGGPRALIEDDSQGLLIPCGDMDALAAAMRKILSDEEYRKMIGKGACNRAEKFRPEVVFDKWEKYFSMVLDH